MGKLISRIILNLAFFCLVSIFPLAATAADVSLESRLSSLHSMKANFTQTILDNHGKAIQQSNGNMALLRPGKFRWETKKPIPQLIIANDAKLWIFDPDLEQVTIRALHHATGESPALLLSHENTTIDKDYVVKTQMKKGSSLTWYVLTPRSEDSVFAAVEMGFNSENLQEMRLQDHLGHSTHIVFKNMQSNIDLPDSLFIFKKTANIDVIDETKRK